MKAGYVLLDGAADRPNPRLNFTTPLEAAYTPNLDSIARSSALGSVITVGRGIAPESDVAVLSMLGYTFEAGYPGRGVIEAIGAEVPFKDGDVAFRANLASVRGRSVVDRRAGRDLTQREAKRLEADLEEVKLRDVEAEFRATIGYRGVLVFRGNERFSAEVTNTDPAYERVRGFGTAIGGKTSEMVQVCRPQSRDEVAKRTARMVNEFTRQALEILGRSEVNRKRVREGKLPANGILVRDAGDHLPVLEKFEQRYGVKGVALVDMPAEIGIAKLLGMKMVGVDDRDDIEGKGELFDRELSERTLVYAHLKGPDEFGHDGDPVGKKKSIEKIDRDFFPSVAERIEDAKIAVSCDHATPCVLLRHSSDPVPLSISGRKEGSRFTERASRVGGLGSMLGPEVLRKFLGS